jgi:hypothetical protein
VEITTELSGLRRGKMGQVIERQAKMATLTELTNTQNLAVNPAPTGLKWYTVKLDGWAKKNGNDPKLIAYIDVSEPLFVTISAADAAKAKKSVLAGEFFIPVTAADTWRIAKANDALPLTRAVADQAHNQAIAKGTAVGFVGSAPLEDFEKFSKELCGKGTASFGRDIYKKKQGTELVSGAHKLWILSAQPAGAKPKAINYGGYVNRAITAAEIAGGSGPGGPYLTKDPATKGWNVVQAAHGAHYAMYWDYSQLLQMMRRFRMAPDSTEYIPLKEAVKDGDHRVWDEDWVYKKATDTWELDPNSTKKLTDADLAGL